MARRRSGVWTGHATVVWPAVFLGVILGAVLGATSVGLPAQVDRMNYRMWSWLQQQRRSLLRDTMGLSLERQAAVARALTSVDHGLPLLTASRAIAIARGIEPDGGFHFRAGLQVFALPEVVARPRDLQVTVWAPFSGLTGEFPMPKKMSFRLVVTDSSGKVVRRAEIAETEEFRDLREFRATCAVPTSDLPEGAYRVRVDTVLDGEAARPKDLPLEVPFAVMHDYAERAGYFRVAKKDHELVGLMEHLDPLSRAVLAGAAEFGCRAWQGIPGVSPSEAVPDLLRAERILANIRAERFLLDGVGGDATIAFPVHRPGEEKEPVPSTAPAPEAPEVVFATLRLPVKGLPKKGSKGWQDLAKKPLMLVMSRSPSLSSDDKRPSFPHYALPGYLAACLRIVEFDAKREFQLVVVESPGRMKNTRAGLLALMRELPALYPFDRDRVVLCGDGHGAAGVVDLARELGDRVRGLVLVNSGGGLATVQLRKMAELPILGIPGHGRLGVQTVALLETYAKHAGKKLGLQILDHRLWPWSLALPLAARHIEVFAREATR